MLTIYLLEDPVLWIVPLIMQIIGYLFLLKKMGLRKITAFIPFLAELQFTTVLFNRMRTFFRPFIIALIFVLAALYLNSTEGIGLAFMWVACLVYGIFLIRLYWRIAKAMGKGKIFAVLLILLPPLFLMILGLGRSQYHPLELKPLRVHSRPVRIMLRTGLVVISALEICVLVAGVGLLTIRDTPPAPMVDSNLDNVYDRTKDVTGTGDVVTREDALGKSAASIASMPVSREHFFKDHSKDKNVVVMEYVVGSNLEHAGGMATANISQMIDATRQGDGLTFVMEAGGAKRWFTKGIDDNSYGRYTIKGGKLEKVKDLPADTCMAEEKSLADFISWTKKKYPADRYMLVLWDHGGGVPYGFGQDDLNDKDTDDIEDMGTMKVSEIISALDQADIRFDVIGFDACLMQDIEIAYAMEPYADYYLASEETEGGYGWFYTSAFGKLAADPGISSEEFGKEIIACYDPYNTIIKDQDGKPDTNATLSFVDLTLAAPAYDRFTGFLKTAGKAVRNDSGCYGDIAVAASNAYGFEADMQIDLIDFIKILDKLDYSEDICSHKEKKALLDSLKASVLFRNGNSAKGVNGLSVALPYKAIQYYSDTSSEFKRMSLKTEKKVFDEIFSIMAAQQKKDQEEKKKEHDAFSPQGLLDMLKYADYTEADWYVEGFEDYDDSSAVIDIPLKETAEGYQIQLPKKAWKIIADCQTMVYQKTGKNGRLKYLGTDHIGSDDADGHPLVAMDDTWVHIGGELVCYEDEPVKSTDEGEVFTGKVRALLNGSKTITLNIEWDPVSKGEEAPQQGHITGYDVDNILTFLNTRSTKNLKAGDTIQFLFDYYDEQGEKIKTKPAGKKIRVTRQNRIVVSDEPLGSCDISYCGLLKDIYQRTLSTEQIEEHIEEQGEQIDE